ncbi:hypothetical protein AWE51_22420 [Aquimarina aggregata]|uniref:Uncharacterized protein n=1 Tax=Aquimarina aggregata TaxID=1642818 RepID=A0A163BJC9_9FLAO|nr:hypothetical protein [Aquimarina aggregata]KZS41460.1 hypothetical protein AWE51_22420 [Aquimarina aggregata]
MSAQENTSEEIDLGQLFKLIGNTIDKFFRFLGNIFKGIFHFLILFLQFLQKHFLKFTVALVIGVLVGGYWDHSSDDVYRSSMIVEPNFNSVQQLYNNIEFYNELAEGEEFQALEEALNIDNTLAKTLKKFTIESFSDQTQKIKQFSEFIQGLDTISQKMVNYDDYLKNFNNINAKFHKITIEAKDPKVAKKCQSILLRSIENNQYFRLQKEINEVNLALQDSIVARQLTEIDSLQKFYRKIKTLEAGKPEGNTSINLAEGDSKATPEIELLSQIKLLKNELVLLNNKKANTQSTINIISAFPNKGVLINDFFKKKMVLLPILLVGVVFVFLILLSINSFLKNYNPK